MKTLIVYDNSGKIWFQASGAVTEPDGLPFLWTDVPSNNYVESVDVSDILNPAPVFKEIATQPIPGGSEAV